MGRNSVIFPPGRRVAASCAILVLCLAAFCVKAQTPSPSTTLTGLLRSRTVHPDGSWSLTLSSPLTTQLTGQEKLPPHGTVHLTDAALWDVEGGTLDLGGATVDAPEGRKIFAGSGHVVGMASARPEWFADAVDGIYPGAALRSALAAVQPGGTILLREASYLSPFFDPHATDPCGGETAKIGPSLTLVGVERPEPNSTTAPTRLTGGTILRGGICAATVLHASHLGVDAGDDVMAHDFGGAKAFGIQLRSGGHLGGLAGTTLDDVTVLATGIANQHSVIIDGQRDAAIRGLWVWTPGGTHGLVVKSLATTVEDFHCRGAFSDCLILKSDYVTDREGDASGSKVDGVDIRYLKTPGDTGGVILEGRRDDLHDIDLNHIEEAGLNDGISVLDSGFYHMSDAHVRNWTANEMTGPCLLMTGGVRFLLDGFHCSIAHGYQAWAFLLAGKEVTLRNGTIACENGQPCAGADAIIDGGRSNRIESVKGTGFGGYLVKTSPLRGGTSIAALDATAMGGRIASLYIEPAVPLRMRFVLWWWTTKPYLRILWNRFGPHGTAGYGGWIAVLLLVFGLGWNISRRKG